VNELNGVGTLLPWSMCMARKTRRHSAQSRRCRGAPATMQLLLSGWLCECRSHIRRNGTSNGSGQPVRHRCTSSSLAKNGCSSSGRRRLRAMLRSRGRASFKACQASSSWRASILTALAGIFRGQGACVIVDRPREVSREICCWAGVLGACGPRLRREPCDAVSLAVQVRGDAGEYLAPLPYSPDSSVRHV
jgi:hypothetical protein